MSAEYHNVELRVFDEAHFTCRTLGTGLTVELRNLKVISIRRHHEIVKEIHISSLANIYRFSQRTVAVCTKKCVGDAVFTTYLLVFDSSGDVRSFLNSADQLKPRHEENIKDIRASVFDKRTDSWSAVQYFQFYSYISQQQNMMQDYIRTSTYQRAILANASADFRGKVVLDVGAGSGILSFFAIQAGATRVYAVEASNMATHCNSLVQANKLAGRIVVISGKIEEITLPEPVDVIISEPMGYMLYNERMLESYVHARKFLAPNLRQPVKKKQNRRGRERLNEVDQSLDNMKQLSDSEQSDEILTDDFDCEDIDIEDQVQDGSTKLSNKSLPCPGIMFPSVANLYIVPFSDEALFAEQYGKANFWYQQSFHGMDLTALRSAAVTEYFNQPIVDTFDIGICPALPCIHKVDFRTVSESELSAIDIPLHYQITTCSTIHGLAFWFDVGFLGSQRDVWLSTAPTEPLTHWYQVRCLLGTPLFVQEGQSLDGRVLMRANSRQSYDVQIELIVPGSETKIVNSLDLKNPHFRYNGYPPAPPPGSHVRSPTETYYANLCAQQQQMEIQSQTVVNNGNHLSLAPATLVGGGILNNSNNNNNGQINYRNSSVYTMNQTAGFLATGSIPNLVQAIPVAVANDSLVQNQSHSMQLSPQPVNNQPSLEFGRFMTSSNPSQIASTMLRSVNIPSATPVIESMTNVSGGGLHTNESMYYNPVIGSTFTDSCFTMNNIVNPNKNWNSGIQQE
ncbi:hypothetical protein MN116_002471 [Schistosoma mekongi]|uniref:type I protein arginine methyltransferase n=1 Tax=Schistosoma mekongi TaxID=38744 RepID=A0AAE1ZJR6_SCHME|nr:hypothetical protein MN116_002471 [Schistosoma mekongi]